MTVGAIYPSERRTYHDSQTGRAVTQLTDSPAEDYHPYFYNPAVTPDGRYLIFFSERTGLSNLFRLELRSGEIVQLTDTRPARAEYWPFTAAVRGVGACLAALGSGGREAFYFEGTELWGVEIESLRARRLLTLPSDRRPSILHADSEGATLVFTTCDEALFMERSQRAYAGEQFPDDRFFQETTSTIIRIDTATGRAEEILRQER
ncbi:MAG: TolB family protein, partial [Anaerolineales bacterium]